MRVITLFGLLLLIVPCTLCFTDCGGGNSQPPPPATYTIGGTVSALAGTGLVLQNNGGSNLAISTSGSFTFAARITSGGAYNVTVFAQPSSPTQACVVTNGSGTASANVTNIQVTCTTTYTIGGTISGLVGSGLTLQDNGGDNYQTLQNGAFAFATAVAAGSAYSVAILTQPANPKQNCVVTNGSGTANANVANVLVTCTTVTFTIGGNVSGLSGGGLVLQDNGSDNLPISANGSFTFSTPVAGDESYGVGVWAQPANGIQTCVVTNSNGVVEANITNVQVTCSATFASGQWTWMTGVPTFNWPGVYGTQGVAAPGNTPGTRWLPMAWSDAAGNFWMFGGEGADSIEKQTAGDLNDLWKFGGREWTWIGGPETCCSDGAYGTQGVAAAGNLPPARFGAASWTDASGDFWLFGGETNTVLSNLPLLSDLWRYDITNQQWTWMGGPDTSNQAGIYGTLGLADPGNVPGARSSAATWTDAAGNFWLFGGIGYDSARAYGSLNDLWKYSAGEWTWMGGSNVVGQPGVYGTQGVAAPANIPSAREQAMASADGVGNVWLFGGEGVDSVGSAGQLNDLWKFSAGKWTWVGGSATVNEPGTYGTSRVANANNIPGARSNGVTWIDAAGTLWIFGGDGLDSAGTLGQLNDLWKYSAGQWTWMSGGNTVNQLSAYGTQGVADPGNVPGARYGSVSWIDHGGRLWVFGGFNSTNESKCGCLPTNNELWVYVP